MEIEFLPAGVDQWLSAREKPARSAGYHVSVVLTAMLKKLKPAKYGRWGGEVTDEKQALWELGYLWEDVLAEMLTARLRAQPGETPLPRIEMERDGIYGTPDQMLFRERDCRVIFEEAKATFTNVTKAEYSKRTLKQLPTAADILAEADARAILDADEFRYWLWQARTYAAMAQSYGLDDGLTGRALRIEAPVIRIRALFLRGNYGNRMVVPRAWELRHTAEELEQWWTTVREFVQDYPDLIQKETGDAPGPEEARR